MKSVIVQPYLDYNGHFYRYTKNLVSYFDSAIPEIGQELEVKSRSNIPRVVSIFKFALWKVTFANQCYKKINSDADFVHLVEFEPLAFLMNLGRFRRFKKVIITLHSVSAPNYSFLHLNLIARLHKTITILLLKYFISSVKTFIVVHYESHRESLIRKGLKSELVFTIPYPITFFETSFGKIKSGRILVFGNLRLDKDPVPILKSVLKQNLDIEIVGKIDPLIMNIISRSHFIITNKFVSDEELTDYFSRSEYVLLPYGNNYTGGAGPMKDALGAGRPIIAPDIPIFKEIIEEYDLGIIFKDPAEISEKISQITEKKYSEFIQNVEAYRSKYTWEYMRLSYINLYNL